MILQSSYIDNKIEIKKDSIMSVEIENKKLFYKFIKDLNNLSKGENTEDLNFFTEQFSELNLSNKVNVITDYFNLEFDSKRNTNSIVKLLKENINEEELLTLKKQYEILLKNYEKFIDNIDLPLEIEKTFELDNILKTFKLRIKENEDLLNNLFLIIDLNNILKNNELLVFVNLKQYFSQTELEEFYKYILSKEENVLLIDSQSYGTTKNNENKLIIDDELQEFMI